MSEVFGVCTERIDHVVMVHRLLPGINTSTPLSLSCLGFALGEKTLLGIVYRLMPGIKEPTPGCYDLRQYQPCGSTNLVGT
jgi:hypothetical protein